MAEPPLPVDPDDRTERVRDLGLRGRIDVTLRDLRGVVRKHRDPVGVDSHEVGVVHDVRAHGARVVISAEPSEGRIDLGTYGSGVETSHVSETTQTARQQHERLSGTSEVSSRPGGRRLGLGRTGPPALPPIRKGPAHVAQFAHPTRDRVAPRERHGGLRAVRRAWTQPGHHAGQAVGGSAGSRRRSPHCCHGCRRRVGGRDGHPQLRRPARTPGTARDLLAPPLSARRPVARTGQFVSHPHA